jgi:uncharacterized DUF497 family protein
VAFERDPAKAKTNYRIHGVRFEEAGPVFDDPYAISIADHEADPSEERFVGIGVGASRTAATTSVSSRPGSPPHTNAPNTRRDYHERLLRFQQG